MIAARVHLALLSFSIASGLLDLRGAEAAQKKKQQQTPSVPISSVYNLSEWLSRPLELGNVVGMFLTSDKNQPLLEVAERLLHDSQFKSAGRSLTIGDLTDYAARFFLKQLPDFYAGPKSPLLQLALDAIEAELKRSLEAAANIEQEAGRLAATTTMHDWIGRALQHFSLLDVGASVARAFVNRLTRPSSVGSACFDDSLHLANGVFGARMWALTMIDAWGKPAPGILTGNLKWEGSREQCSQVTVPRGDMDVGQDARSETKGFSGNYCSITFEQPNAMRLMLQNSETTGSLVYGVCVPSTCNADDVRTAVESLSFFGKQLFMISASRCDGDVEKTSFKGPSEENEYCLRNAASEDADSTC